MKYTFLIIIALALQTESLKAQDTLLLLSGKQIPGMVSDDTGVDLIFDVTNKKGKKRSLRYPREDIYSIKKGNDPAQVIYKQDELLGYDLNPEDMRYYMHGQSDARGHNLLWNDLAGFAFGAGSAMYLGGGAVPYVTPVVYSLSMQVPVIKVQKKAISNEAFKISPYYLEGYNKTSRSKKFIHGFVSTMAGVIVGSGILIALD